MSIVERALAKASALGRAQEKPSGTPLRPRTGRLATPPGLLAASDKTPIDLNGPSFQTAALTPPEDMEPLIAEELRVIKRPLLLNAENRDAKQGNLLMVGSALPGAGKTFMSFNIAKSMASELDWTVLLIDADVTRPTLSRGFGLADAPGLIDLLESDRGSIADYTLTTSLPGLLFLPAGVSRAGSKELLGSQRMQSLIDELSSAARRRMVIFDSPPLLLTSEARVLASYMGQVVLIVEAGITPRRSLLEAIELLDPAKAINLVLNKNRRLFGVGDYYYYPGYGSHGREQDT